MVKIKTGVSLPEAIMKVIDTAAEKWYLNRGDAITRIVQEWDSAQIKQLPLAVEEAAEEPTDQMMRRLRVQGLPGFIPNDLEKAKITPSSPTLLPLGEGGEVFHLGTGPGDEAGK